MRRLKRVSYRVREAVAAQSPTSPVRQLLLDALDMGWTVPLISEHTKLSRHCIYDVIHDPDGLCRRSTLQKLRDTISTPPPVSPAATT